MPKHHDEFELNPPLAEAVMACKRGVAALDWKVLEEGEGRLVCKEDQEAISFNWAATAEISLIPAGPRETRVSVSGSNFGWGKHQKEHLAGQLGNLRNKITVAAADAAAPVGSPIAGDLTRELERLAELRSDGLLTDEEFTSAKAKLLGT